MKKSKIDKTAQSFINLLMKYFFITIALIFFLDKLGFDTKSILASMGILGLTIGFAAKDVLSNVISGIFIFIDRPFVLGDLIEIEGNYGKVEKITLRSTRLVTVDGKMLAIPGL